MFSFSSPKRHAAPTSDRWAEYRDNDGKGNEDLYTFSPSDDKGPRWERPLLYLFLHIAVAATWLGVTYLRYSHPQRFTPSQSGLPSKGSVYEGHHPSSTAAQVEEPECPTLRPLEFRTCFQVTFSFIVCLPK